MPGVLIIEAIAHVTAVIYCSVYVEQLKALHSEVDKSFFEQEIAEEIANHVGYLVDVKSMKFKKVVYPGDSMCIKVWEKVLFGILSQIDAVVTVDNQVVEEGKITVS